MQAIVWISRFIALPVLSWLAGFLTMATVAHGGPAPMRFAVSTWFGDACALLTLAVIVCTPVFYAAMFGLRRITTRARWFVVLGGAVGLVAGFCLANVFAGFNLEHVVTRTFDEWLTSTAGVVGAFTGLAAGLSFGFGFSHLFPGDTWRPNGIGLSDHSGAAATRRSSISPS